MKQQSLWASGLEGAVSTQALQGDARTEVLVIGAGMAGILCAHMLKEAGAQCIVVEGNKIGSGVTRNTTAKVTAQHALMYAQLIQKIGESKARQYYLANRRAVDDYRALASGHLCDWEEKTAFVYSTGDRKKLDQEAEAYRKLEIPMRFDEKAPLPVKVTGALGMEGQAQFHPLKLLMGVAQELTIYEDTFVTGIEGSRAATNHGVITADHIVLATHYPMVNVPGLYFMKIYQHRSYVIALSQGPQINGMYIDEREDGFSFRNARDFLLMGGGDRKTGQAEHKGGGYAPLRELAKKAYPGKEIAFEWSAQDCMTLDGMPYIGKHRRSDGCCYVATGFQKWGMTGSMVAARVLSDLITKGRSEEEELFSPQRSMLHGQLLVNLGSAAVNMARVNKRCPHLGCAMRWNDAEKTWECPCHGSRFGEDGRVIDNPAKRSIRVE